MKGVLISVTDLRIRLEKKSTILEKYVAFVISIPSIETSHDYASEEGSTEIRKRIYLPNDFSIRLYESDHVEMTNPLKTILIDCPKIDLINLGKSYLDINISNMENQPKIKLSANLKGLRAGFSPKLLKIINELLDLEEVQQPNSGLFQSFSESEISGGPGGGELFQSVIDQDVDDNLSFAPITNNFVADYYSEEDDEEREFFDCEDPPQGDYTNIEAQNVNNFDQLNTNDPNLEVQIKIEQSTLTFVYDYDATTSEIFYSDWKSETLYPPPCTATNHITFYGLETCIDFNSFPSTKKKIKFSIKSLGAVEYVNNQIHPIKIEESKEQKIYWKKDEFFINDLFLFTNSNIPGINKNLVELELTFDPVNGNEYKGNLGSVILSIDNHTISRFANYMKLIDEINQENAEKLLKNNHKKDEKIQTLSVGNLMPTEEDEENPKYMSNININFEKIILQLKIKNQPKKIDFLEFAVTPFTLKTILSTYSKTMEWNILFDKFTVSRNYMEPFFQSKLNEHTAIKVIIAQPEINNEQIDKTSDPNAPNASEDNKNYFPGKREFRGAGTGAIDENYEHTLKKSEMEEIKQKDSPIGDEKKVFEGRYKNAEVSQAQIPLFILNSIKYASKRITFVLPDTWCEITKPLYDYLFEFIHLFTSSRPAAHSNDAMSPSTQHSIDPPAETQNSGLGEEENKILEAIRSSFTFEWIVNDLMLTISSGNNVEDIESQSYQINFENIKLFYVSNFKQRETSYLYTRIGNFKMIKASSDHKPVKLIDGNNKMELPIIHPVFSTVLQWEKNVVNKKTLIIELNNLLLKYQLGSTWMTHLKDFFTPPTLQHPPHDEFEAIPLPEPSHKEEFYIYLNINDLNFLYLPFIHSDSRDCNVSLLFSVTAQGNQLIQSPSAPSAPQPPFDLYFYNVLVFLANSNLNHEINFNSFHSNNLSKIGFRNIGNLGYLGFQCLFNSSPLPISSSSLSNSSLAPSSNLLSFHFKLSNNECLLSVCEDSYFYLCLLYCNYLFYSTNSSVFQLPPSPSDGDDENIHIPPEDLLSYPAPSDTAKHTINISTNTSVLEFDPTCLVQVFPFLSSSSVPLHSSTGSSNFQQRSNLPSQFQPFPSFASPVPSFPSPVPSPSPFPSPSNFQDDRSPFDYNPRMNRGVNVNSNPFDTQPQSFSSQQAVSQFPFQAQQGFHQAQQVLQPQSFLQPAQSSQPSLQSSPSSLFEGAGSSFFEPFQQQLPNTSNSQSNTIQQGQPQNHAQQAGSIPSNPFFGSPVVPKPAGNQSATQSQAFNFPAPAQNTPSLFSPFQTQRTEQNTFPQLYAPTEQRNQLLSDPQAPFSIQGQGRGQAKEEKKLEEAEGEEEGRKGAFVLLEVMNSPSDPKMDEGGRRFAFTEPDLKSKSAPQFPFTFDNQPEAPNANPVTVPPFFQPSMSFFEGSSQEMGGAGVNSFVSKSAVVRVNKNYLDNIKNEEKLEEKRYFFGVEIKEDYKNVVEKENIFLIPQEYPKPDILFSVDDFNCKIEFCDGKSWSSTGQESKDKNNKVQVEIKSMKIQFYQFLTNPKYSWRLGFAIKDLEILDNLETSTKNKLLCANSKRSRLDGSNIIEVFMELKNLLEKPDPRITLRLSVLPLRLFLDQDTKDFISRFFSKQLPQVPTEKSYYEEITVSDILLEVDYVAKHLNLISGDCLEILNWCSLKNAIFRLNGFTIKDDKTTLADIGCEIQNQWLGYLRGYALGLGPLSSIKNLSKGVSDFIYYPYKYYHEKGRLWQGISFLFLFHV